jgi:ubiquitin-like 1-activating enzyme E1 A
MSDDQSKKVSQQTIEEVTQDQNFIERNDRSFRALSVEVVMKLVQSKVAITPLNGPNTELMKNLILDCVGVTIFDEHIIDDNDIDINFMLGPNDLGKNRGDVLLEKFKDMNPYAKLDKKGALKIKEIYDSEITLVDKSKSVLAAFDAIAVSTTSFAEMKLWDKLCTHLNKPLFILNCSGLYGFIWINLGPDYRYVGLKQKVEVFKIINGEYKRVGEESKDEYEHVFVKSASLAEGLNAESPDKTQVYYAIQMMAQAEEQNLILDPFNLDEAKYNKVVEIGKTIWTNNKKKWDDKAEAFFKNFARLFGVEYCPVYSVLGSVASQEFTKVISRRNDPSFNWFSYDSQQGYGRVEYVQSIDNLKRELIKDQ